MGAVFFSGCFIRTMKMQTQRTLLWRQPWVSLHPGESSGCSPRSLRKNGFGADTSRELFHKTLWKFAQSETDWANKLTLCWMMVRKIKVCLFKTVLTKFCENSTCSFLPRNGEMRWQGGGGDGDRNSLFFVRDYSNFSLKQSNENISSKHCQIVAHLDYFPLEVSPLFKWEKKQKRTFGNFPSHDAQHFVLILNQHLPRNISNCHLTLTVFQNKYIISTTVEIVIELIWVLRVCTDVLYNN